MIFLLKSAGLRFVFPEGLRENNGQLCVGLAKSVTEKNNEGKAREVNLFYPKIIIIELGIPGLAGQCQLVKENNQPITL